ncbi:uncharacterized protein LOC128392183 [Panonychus citri]|uniref:uncharacterized protein LOC128392183 n=1 Tax=Panonychus citri TaxID=50023 RepID=UPI002307D49A|nr:uncharacterized protein LOC128392183 [Panonychus citri]
MMDFESRISKTMNKVNKCLLQLMRVKKSNLCLAVDLTRSADILDIADRFGPHIVALKLHVCIIEDFDYQQFTEGIGRLKEKHSFLVFEDFKFADIGSTNQQLYVGGIFRIQDWADLITAHVISGPGAIEALMKGVNSSGDPRGCLLIAKMSSKGSSLDEIENCRQIGDKFPNFVSGFISQSPVTNDPGFIQFTPGVNIDVNCGALGQQYVSPEEAVINRGADIIIVGSGILKSEDPLAKLLQFKQRGFNSYLKKITPSN